MTLHSSKGLEFDFVFIIGAEEGLLPHSRSFLEEEELEEERRLCYVGITRAKRKLFITFAEQRLTREGFSSQLPSRFLGRYHKIFVNITVIGNHMCTLNLVLRMFEHIFCKLQATFLQDRHIDESFVKF